MPINRRRRLLFTLLLCLLATLPSKTLLDAANPIKALLVTGGCCHDYPFQARALQDAPAGKGRITWTVVNEGGSGTRGMIRLYDDPGWASGYDVVVHNECFADTDDADYIRRITAVHHAGVPAVVIHCAMHTYRAAKIDDWRELLGVTSRHHEHQSRYPVVAVDPGHPILAEFPEQWTTPKDELYVIEKLWPSARALAVSKSEKSGQEQPVFWINTYGKARVFGTTYGHSNETFSDPVFTTTVIRGLLWAARKLEEDDDSASPATGLQKRPPELVQPDDNPTTPEKVELGRLLFFDPLLSGDNSMSCAHCHHPDLGFSDGLPRARGKGASGVGPKRTGGVELARATPTVWNALYNHRQFWDGRAANLEIQARGPITSPVEMDEDPERLTRELAAIPEYRNLFDRAFRQREGSGVTLENVQRAIAAFERTLVTFDSKFDRYAAGDNTALSDAERNGLKLFLSPKTRCAECHGLPTFANRAFKVIGVPDPTDGPPDKHDPAAESDRGGGPTGAFKVPTLRNVALTAPYMHNGTLKSLPDVLDFYAEGGGRGRGLRVPLQDDKIRKFQLTGVEKRDLVAFLEALTDVSALPEIPTRVPSALPVVERLSPLKPLTPTTAPTALPRPLARNEADVRPGESVQAAVDRVGRGGLVRVHPGTYHESVLVIHHDVTIAGVIRDGIKPVLDGRSVLADGIAALGNRFEVRDLEVRNYQGNGIVVHGAKQVAFRGLVLANPGLYGVYPVECEDVIVESCKVSGASDAGIYVGQSRGIVVRNNEVFQNVAGIEIENSSDALVEGNHVHGNTGGILVFVLPFNPSKEGKSTRVVRNRIVGNNTPNFAAPGAMVAGVIRGAGVVVLAADDTEVAHNELRDNASYAIGVSSLIGFFPPGTNFDVEPNSDRTRVHSNILTGNATSPDERLERLYKLPGRDLIWDGTGQGNVWKQPGATSFPAQLPAAE